MSDAKNWKVLKCSDRTAPHITGPREGVIIECHLNGQYHNRCDIILTSRMAVSNNFITVTIIQNIGKLIILI